MSRDKNSSKRGETLFLRGGWCITRQVMKKPSAGAVLQHRPKDECGVFAVFGHPHAAEITFFGLYALQHRGQESAGIVVHSEGDKKFKGHHGMGLVPQIFNDANLAKLTGTRAIGHVRYSTTGSSTLENAQPIVVDCARGQIAIGHNGNLVNANLLRHELEAKGAIFKTTVDSEVILHLMAQPSSHGGRQQRWSRRSAKSPARSRSSSSARGRSSACAIPSASARSASARSTTRGCSPARAALSTSSPAPNSSATSSRAKSSSSTRRACARSSPLCQRTTLAFCIFEYVYFARPDSVLEGVNVSHVRTNMGRELARLHPVEADLVIPVPDSGNYAALGFSEESGIPYDAAFVRNHYVGRTFLNPSQLAREFGVKVKLNIIKERVKGKRVVVVDDSIVRGTTARSRVMNLRNAGAKEVHIRISVVRPTAFPATTASISPIPRTSSRTSFRSRKSRSISRLIRSATSTKPAWSAPPAAAKTNSAWPASTRSIPSP